MSVHRINLKGPWEYTWIAGGPGDDAGGRARMPVDWVAAHGDVAGTVRWSRRFQRPTNLAEGDRVFVAFAGVGGAAFVRLGDVPLGYAEDTAGVRFEITEHLERTNELHVEIGYDPARAERDGPGGLYGVVTIEIESSGPGSSIGGGPGGPQ